MQRKKEIHRRLCLKNIKETGHMVHLKTQRNLLLKRILKKQVVQMWLMVGSVVSFVKRVT
jgi:hypothetical protein